MTPLKGRMSTGWFAPKSPIRKMIVRTFKRNIEWEDYDLAPDYPELKRFLEIFSNHLDGAIDVVRVYDTNYARPLDRIYAPTSTSFH